LASFYKEKVMPTQLRDKHHTIIHPAVKQKNN